MDENTDIISKENESEVVKAACELIGAKLKGGLSNLSDLERKAIIENVIGVQPSLRKFKNSVPTYYREKFALHLKSYLDQMVLDPEHKALLWSAAKMGLTRNSLHSRFTQAFTYLIDFLDPDGKYAELRQQLEVAKHAKGVMILWKFSSDTPIESYFEPLAVKQEDIDEGLKWKDELDKYLNEAVEGEAFLKDKIKVDRDWVMKQLENVLDKFVIMELTLKKIHIQKNEVAAKILLQEE